MPAELVTATVAGQRIGIPVLTVQDVLNPHPIARVPLAPPEVAGLLNLRGRIVTAIDLRVRLGLPPADEPGRSMSLVVEHQGDLYSLLVDAVGEVLQLSDDQYERNPVTLDPLWREMSHGVYWLDGQLLVQLDVPRLLNLGKALAA